MRKYLVVYFSSETNDWEYQRVRMHPGSVRGWLAGFEKSGYNHAYEVAL